MRVNVIFSRFLRACPLGVLGFSVAFLPRVVASERQVLTGHIPTGTASLRPTAALPANTRLNLAIGLPLRNQDALGKLLADLYSPASPQYHQYLTAAEFTSRFGPTPEDYEAVATFAQAHGLTVTARHPNRMLLDVSGAVGDIEACLHLKLQRYAHPRENRTFFAPDREPSLDLSVPILHIGGLDDFELPRPASLKFRPPPSGDGPTPLVGSGPGGLYRGNDFRHAYAAGVTLNGSNQMVGLFELDSYYTNDIATYRSQGNLAAVPLIDVYVDGATSTPGTNNIEVALDIEVAMSMAPGLAAIIVYQSVAGYPADDLLNRMATDNLAKQLSASWTFPTDATALQVFQEYAAQGQAYFNASGDRGAYAGAISSPVDRPYVIAVGGTTLSTATAGGSWSSETSWNWYSTGSGTSGTGGGISTTYPIPPWQQGVASLSTNGGSLSLRNVPDVAMIADQTYVIYDNGASGGVGGTSVSSPLWAAFTALINQQAVSLGQSPVGFLNPAVYAIGNGPGYSTNFHDITTGNNTNPASPTRFYATASYDLCTGWGSPIGLNLINTLAPRANARVVVGTGTTLVAEGCSPGNGAVDPGETVTLNFGLKNIGAVKVTNLVATLQQDSGVLSPSGPRTYGALTSGGSTVTRAFTFTANGSCGSNVTATLQLQDGATDLGTVGFNIPLGKPVAVATQNFDSVTTPALPSGWSTTTSSGGVGWITSTALHDTAPNAAYAAEPTNAGLTELVSPLIPITTSAAQLSFRNNFNCETDPVLLTNAYDGGVLEIKIGAGSFMDILAAGGTFVTGGYNRSVSSTNTVNPLFGRQVWSGLSGGFITTLVNLPAAAAGQSVQFKWRFGTDTGNFFGGTGWFIDTILVQDGYSCCSSSADLAIAPASAPNPVLLGANLTYTLAVSNLGPSTASSVTVTDTLPANATFVSASGGGVNMGNSVVYQLGPITAGTGTNISVVVTPLATGLFTNTAASFSLTPDPAPGNNSALEIGVAMEAPLLTNPILGGAGISVSIGSVLGVNYQLEYKNLLTDPAWTPLAPLVPGTGSVITLQDTNAPTAGSRFYRVTCLNGF